MLFYYSWRFLEVALKSADCTDLFFNYNVKILAIFIWPFFYFLKLNLDVSFTLFFEKNLMIIPFVLAFFNSIDVCACYLSQGFLRSLSRLLEYYKNYYNTLLNWCFVQCLIDIDLSLRYKVLTMQKSL